MEKKKFKLSPAKPDSKPSHPSSVTKFQGTVGEIDFVIDLAAELRINEKDLVSDMVKHAGSYGWWAALLATAKGHLRQKKRKLADVRSNLDGEARIALKEDSIKVTETAVNAWVLSDTRMKDHSEELDSLENIVEFVESVLRAFEHRRDMLKEINRAQLSEGYSVKN